MRANAAGDEQVMKALTLGVAAGVSALECFDSAWASALLGVTIATSWIAGGVLTQSVGRRFVSANDNAVQEPSTEHVLGRARVV